MSKRRLYVGVDVGSQHYLVAILKPPLVPEKALVLTIHKLRSDYEKLHAELQKTGVPAHETSVAIDYTGG